MVHALPDYSPYSLEKYECLKDYHVITCMV